MHIAFVASEGVPFSKTGGLADVVGALPRALASLRRARADRRVGRDREAVCSRRGRTGRTSPTSGSVTAARS